MAQGRHSAIPSRCVHICCQFNEAWIIGGCCCTRTLHGIDACPVYVSQVKPGPSGGSSSCSWALVADRGVSVGGSYRYQCAATRVRYYLRLIRIPICSLHRLNVHLSSIVSSKPFQMPVEVLPRATYTHRMSRLSSFGFSGTIAHGAFDIHRPAVADKLIISSATSIYRAQYSHEGLRVKHFRRLASFHSSRRDTSKAMPEVQSAMYCR